jgi:4-amino-4-deoxy-L-arabinose transferase-like glycosyltransferase
MKKSKTTSPILRQLVGIIIGLIIIVGVAVRFIDLEADPPLYFDGSGQSLSTDPYQYTFHARNKVVFGESDPLHQEQWRVFEYTLVSGISYLLFSLFGASRLVANLSGILLSLAAIFIFGAALKKIFGWRGATMAVLFLILNKVLFVYGRLPYIENGMMFWMAVLFYVFVSYRHKVWGQILLGSLAILAGLLGKMFGIVILVPLVFAFWIERRRESIRAIIIMAVSGLAITVIWALIAYGGNLRLFLNYLYMQSLGLYGTPESLTSPLTFIERLISFGNDSRFYFLAPAIGIGLFAAIVSVIRKPFDNENKSRIPIYFLILWIVVYIAFFMIQNYRPIRYAFMLYLPMAGLMGYIFFTNGELLREEGRNFGKYITAILLFLIFWVFLEQACYGWYREEGFVAMHRKLVWITFLPAALSAYLEMRYDFLKKLMAKKKTNQIVLASLIILAIWNFGSGYWTWQKQKSYNIKEAASDLNQILNPEAILCGPIAPTFIMDNKLKGMVYALGISGKDRDLFQKFPATHFAIDVDASGRIIEEFPELETTQKIADFWIRDADVAVVDIYKLTGNQSAESYRPTLFEIGRQFMNKKVFDSALIYVEQFANRYPDNKSALLALSDLYPIAGETNLGLLAIKKAVMLYPRDFSVLMTLGSFYEKSYIATGDRSYLNQALDKYREALALNPFQEDEITRLRERLSRFRNSP